MLLSLLAPLGGTAPSDVAAPWLPSTMPNYASHSRKACGISPCRK